MVLTGKSDDCTFGNMLLHETQKLGDKEDDTKF